MDETFSALSAIAAVLRSVLLGGGIALAAVAAADWAVRTRRINPFSGVARFTRSRVDPRLAGIERQVIRIGGHQSATPWWALVAYIVVAALVLAGIDMITALLRQASIAATLGAAGFLFLAVRWTFAFLQIALLIRVISSWFPRFGESRWVRWSYGATDWILRPLRRVIPSIGMIDITPIVAYFGLQLVEWLVLQLLSPMLR